MLRFAKPKKSGRALSDLGVILTETVSLIQAQAKTQKVSVVLEIPKDLPAVLADKDQLKQVFLNLLLNACQAMPSGGELSAKAYQTDGVVAVDIKDTGVGIKPQDIQNIFNPFFTTKAEGTGLGLALSFAVMESHGGTLNVKSEEGKGATFTLTLPLPDGTDEKTA